MKRIFDMKYTVSVHSHMARNNLGQVDTGKCPGKAT